jgi:hypothetical protein
MFPKISAEWEARHYPLPNLDDEDDMIPTVSLQRCEYDRGRKVLKLASEFFGMPREFFVESHHTGKTVRFTVVGEHDKLFDPDQWDGEQQVYRPVGNVPGVDHMVIYNQW